MLREEAIDLWYMVSESLMNEGYRKIYFSSNTKKEMNKKLLSSESDPKEGERLLRRRGE